MSALTCCASDLPAVNSEPNSSELANRLKRVTVSSRGKVLHHSEGVVANLVPARKCLSRNGISRGPAPDCPPERTDRGGFRDTRIGDPGVYIRRRPTSPPIPPPEARDSGRAPTRCRSPRSI